MSTSRVVDHLGEVLHAAADAAAVGAAPEQQAARVDAERRMRDGFEDEVSPLVRAVVAQLRESDTLPPGVTALFDQGSDPEHAGLFDVLTSIIIAFCFQVMGSLVPPLLQDAANDQWRRFQAVPLSAPELAVAVNKGWLSQDDAADQATLTGYDAHRFDTMVKLTGQPPGIEQMLLLYRRGQATEADLDRAIRESNIRPEWIPFVKDLRYAPPGAGEVVSAAVQGHLDIATAQQKLGEAGIDPAQWDWIYETVGRPPGAQELIALLRRGKVTEQQVRDAIRESNIKNKYIDAIIATREHIPPMRTAISLVRKGVATPAQGTQWLLDLGFNPDVAAQMIREASTDATAGAKQISAAAFLTAYRDGLASEAETSTGLVGLGYQPADATFLLRTAAFQRDHAASAEVVGVVRSRFIAHRIEAADARNDLAALGVDPANADRLLGLWQVARDDTVAELTQPQTSAIYKKGLITDADYRARLAKLGYAPVDVELLVAFNAPAVAEPPV